MAENALAEIPAEEDRFLVVDVLDETLIRQELAGVNVDELVYEFPIGDKIAVGLTVYGTIALSRILVEYGHGISILGDKPTVERREESRTYKAYCKVSYVKPDGSRLEFYGTKVQPFDIKNKQGEVVKKDDPNAETITEMKALRNGLDKIFPPKQSAKFLNQWRKEGKIKRLDPDEVKDAVAGAKAAGQSSAARDVITPPPSAPKAETPSIPGFMHHFKSSIPSELVVYFQDAARDLCETYPGMTCELKFDQEKENAIAVIVKDVPVQSASQVRSKIKEIEASILGEG